MSGCLYDDAAYRFTGIERDSETGLDHTLFRNYASTMGRWTSPDQWGGDVRNPQTLNKYSYVLNNPLSYTDPLGLMYCKVSKGKDGKEQTSDCVSDDDYNKNQDKYPDHTKLVRQEEVTVSADGKSSQLPAWHSYTTFIAGVPYRLRGNGGDLSSQAYMLAIRQALSNFPNISSVGGFGYAGYEFDLFGRDFGVEGLVELDSEEGLSSGFVITIGGEHASVGGTGLATKNALKFDAPIFFLGGTKGVLIQPTMDGKVRAIGAYAGRISPVPSGRKIGYGAGAYGTMTNFYQAK